MEVSGRKRGKAKTRVILHPKIFCKRVLKQPTMPVELKPEDEDPKSDFLLITSRPKKFVRDTGLEVGLSDLMLEMCQELRLAEDKDGPLLQRVEISNTGPSLEQCPTVDRLGILMDLNFIEMGVKAHPYDILGLFYYSKILSSY